MEPWTARALEAAVGDDGDRLAEPSITSGAGRRGEVRAAFDQPLVGGRRFLEQVLHLRTTHAARGVRDGRQRGADLELRRGVGRSNHGSAGDAPFALDALEAVAEILQV